MFSFHLVSYIEYRNKAKNRILWNAWILQTSGSCAISSYPSDHETSITPVRSLVYMLNRNVKFVEPGLDPVESRGNAMLVQNTI